MDSSDQLTGFFFIDPVFLMLDFQNKITVQLFNMNNYYVQGSAQKTLGIVPNLVVKNLKYSDVDGNQLQFYYLIYQDTEKQFSITYMYTSYYYNSSV